MITGKVRWPLEATVGIEIQDANGDFHAFQCTLDTGFDGDLALPSGAIGRLGLIPSNSRYVNLADGVQIFMQTCNARVLWHEQIIDVEVLQTNNESYIGMALMENSIVTLQVWSGGDVLIEPRQGR